jgi:AmpE protein
MTLLVFMLAYLLRRRLDSRDLLDGHQLWRSWFEGFGQRLPQRLSQSTSVLAPLLAVAIPTAVVWLAQSYWQRYDWPLAGWTLELLLLLLLLGMPGWRQPLLNYARAWRRGDMQAAWRYIQHLLPAHQRGAALSPETMQLALSEALMAQVFWRYFMVLFWYAVGGISAAVLASGLVALGQSWPQSGKCGQCERWREWGGWLPARLLALTFGLAGDLAGWLRQRRQARGHWQLPASELLMATANGALTGYALDPGRFASLHPQEWLMMV